LNSQCPGHLIIDPAGTIVAQDAGGGDEIVSARSKLHDSTHSPIRQRRPELYGELVKQSLSGGL
jgi:hypothetical protein